MLGADDSLDVFGVHAVGGILGALLTGVFDAPSLGGPGFVSNWVTGEIIKAADYSIAGQVWIQAKAVGVTIVWSGVVAFVAYKIVDLVVGLRVSEEDEREGLDISVARRVGVPDVSADRQTAGPDLAPPGLLQAGRPRTLRRFSSVATRGAPNAPRFLCATRRFLVLPSTREAFGYNRRSALPRLRRMVPHLTTALTGPLQDLERRILDRMPDIERWLRTQWQEHAVPFYASVDLRNAGFKLAPVDTNLFPGGFNNLNPAFLPLCVQAVQAAVERVCPDARGVLLVPENHTRNTFYLQNVATLVGILRQAGMRVRIGSLIPEITEPTRDRAAGRRAR